MNALLPAQDELDSMNYSLNLQGGTYNKAYDSRTIPTEEFYGVAAVFKDDSGNWFSLGEKPKE